MFSKGLLIGKHPFQDKAMPGKKLPFSGHNANKFQRPTILQLNIQGFTASKMNILHYLALQSETLVILFRVAMTSTFTAGGVVIYISKKFKLKNVADNTSCQNLNLYG